MRRLPLMVLMAVPVVMLETVMAELDVSVGCFPLSAVATFTPAIVTAATLRLLLVVKTSCFAASVVDISTPAKYSRGVNRLD